MNSHDVRPFLHEMYVWLGDAFNRYKLTLEFSELDLYVW